MGTIPGYTHRPDLTTDVAFSLLTLSLYLPCVIGLL